ncbi:camp-dependent protein kinase 1 [Gilbertella persicaria]|uniref:camp-dependent protein kinase 1 n=1 Tax=Gilbertella persicaria TaxID=101096 RepID=UPI00221F13FF|nr:camp-dependent protein kinase 1 [Gilbertella persicaria]KAI8053666.1 camp-dependent protein kinase 1 [Gilbertella persicaria]
MSFIHKIIDRATRNSSSSSSSHYGSSEEKPQRRSFFGFGANSNGSTTINNKEQEDAMSTTSNGKENKRFSGTHQSLGKSSCSSATVVIPEDHTKEKEREKLIQQYANYDRAILEQRKNRPRLKLEDFNLLRTLGTGSFGRVHLAQSKHNGRYYAIKVLKKSEVVRLKQVEHTNLEKAILEITANPFIVNLWGTFQDDINLYMVMDYVPGGELFSVLRKNQRFPDHVAKFYAAEVVLAIEYFHSKNIIYRDLKPENLLLDSQGHIKITDFGFAKHVPDVTWTLCGTPDYLAPEVIQSKGYGMAVDWWSLGILIFEMLAGHPPFYDDDHLKLYEKIIQGKIKWPAYFDPHAKDLLKRLLTADLSRRYGNLKGGAEDIKNHKWFSGVDFVRMANRQVRSPYVPTIRGEGDASNFDRYPETNERYGISGPDPYRDKFADF